MKKSIVLGALSVGLACTAWASTAAELMPLAMGNYWVYREARTGETFTIRVGQPVALQSGNVYHYLIGYTASSYVLARIDTNGNLVALDEENGVETLLTGFAEPEGRWWPAPGRGECATVKQEGQTQEKRMQYDGPGGRWNGALEVRYQSPGGCADTGVLAEQFTENIGMLRRVVTTIAGPRTFDLVYARVGTQIIETRDRGRFSVAVDPPTEADDSLRVTLRVDLGFTPSIRLRFPSSQVFDVALRDAAGKVVWQWSEGRLFDQATREVNIGNVWNETVRVPRPAGAGGRAGHRHGDARRSGARTRSDGVPGHGFAWSGAGSGGVLHPGRAAVGAVQGDDIGIWTVAAGCQADGLVGRCDGDGYVAGAVIQTEEFDDDDDDTSFCFDRGARCAAQLRRPRIARGRT